MILKYIKQFTFQMNGLVKIQLCFIGNIKKSSVISVAKSEFEKTLTASDICNYEEVSEADMYHYVCQMNRDPKHHFYILGTLNDKVIASCFVSTYIDYLGDECIENLKSKGIEIVC